MAAPTVPVYRSQVQARPVRIPEMQARTSAGDFGGYAAAGTIAGGERLRQGTRDLMEAQRFSAALQQQQDNAEATRQIANWRAKWTDSYQQARQNAPEDPTGFADGFLKGYDDDARATLADMAPGVRSILESRMTDFRTSLAERAGEFENTARGQLVVKNTNAAIDVMANTVRRDEGLLAASIADANAGIDAANLPGWRKVELREAARQRLARSAVEGLVERDPRRAKADLDGGVFDGLLSPEGRQIMGNQARIAVDRLEAEAERARREAAADARAELSLVLQDEKASIRASGKGGMVSPSLVYRAFPGQPERAAGILAELNREKEFYNTRQRLALTSPAEDAEVLTQLQQSVTGPGAAQTAQQLQDAQTIIRHKQGALLKDPAGYILATSPYIQGLWENGQNDPAVMRQAGQMMLDEQERLGVPIERRRVLPEAQADAVAGQFQQQLQGGQDAATLIQSMQGQWGPLWPKVYEQLAKDEKLPATVTVLAAMDPGRASTALAEAIKVGPQVLKDTLDKESAKAVSDGVEAELKPLRQTMASLPGGERSYAAYAKAVETLGHKYVSEGMSANAALQRAAQDVVLSRYQFVGSYRVPRDQPMGEIRDGAAVSRATLPEGIDVPASTLPPDLAATAYRKQVAARGYWVTAPDESGLVLYDETQSAVLVNGRPYRLTWEELAAAGQKSRGAGIPDPVERGRSRMIREEEAARRAREAIQ